MNRSRSSPLPTRIERAWRPSPALINALLESAGAVNNHEATWRRPDGSSIRVRESARVFRDENGAPLYYETTVQDVTEQYLASQTVREQEQRWELALRANQDGIWERNWQTQESWYSDRYAEMLGYKPGELNSQWEDRIHPDDAARVKAVMAAHLRGETDRHEAEYRIRCKDGTYKWILPAARRTSNRMALSGA